MPQKFGTVEVKIADLEPVKRKLEGMRELLLEIKEFSEGHHGDEDSCYWLHALTVDIPRRIEIGLDELF